MHLISVVFLQHYLRFRFLLPAARFSEYAIATACFTGFPALTSARTFERKADLDVLRFNGISSLQLLLQILDTQF